MNVYSIIQFIKVQRQVTGVRNQKSGGQLLFGQTGKGSDQFLFKNLSPLSYPTLLHVHRLMNAHACIYGAAAYILMCLRVETRGHPGYHPQETYPHPLTQSLFSQRLEAHQLCPTGWSASPKDSPVSASPALR